MGAFATSAAAFVSRWRRAAAIHWLAEKPPRVGLLDGMNVHCTPGGTDDGGGLRAPFPDSHWSLTGSALRCTRAKLMVPSICGGDRDQSRRPLMAQLLKDDVAVRPTRVPKNRVPSSILANVDRMQAESGDTPLWAKNDVVLVAGKP